jgi:hypothetical protein
MGILLLSCHAAKNLKNAANGQASWLPGNTTDYIVNTDEKGDLLDPLSVSSVPSVVRIFSGRDKERKSG